MSRKVQFDVVLREDTFYKGFDSSIGCTIKGHLSLVPISNIKIKRLYLKFEGKHTVSTATDFRRSEEIFFQREWSFLSHERGQTFEGGKPVQLDFTLFLPGDLPETVKAEYGSIQYKFKAYADTSIMYSNLKAEKQIYLRRHTSALLSERYITEAADVWREAVSYYLCIPTAEVAPGDEFPLRFQHRVLSDTIRVLLTACILKERIVYYSPGDHNTILREYEKPLDATFTWCQEDHMGEGQRVINVKIPSMTKTFDSRNKYIEVTHRLHIRVDVDWRGKLENVHIDLPVVIVPEVQGVVEELPDYNALPSPPSYEEYLSTHPPTFGPVQCLSVMT
ncbi:hypothetical protein K493DRAFT_298223 [Basidiobolus meristosporus CBS 931.73]|uniref:Arrestin C-terminal-like domain-containing protein n=1 Tax=Basidiobolus meristosporus CBS 931.73 TaxID=1314790 RepID=A0A1Y1YUT0_9FUNG|nr:hypothetical protein K493DRAFT_298223 [Basidiobolus meristosporus CBS 931.73]|eukprot:ORY01780.1 hypothetical protein K493DRAFT_298223 [Basidiobolus meristosporus CBS 931.73]